MSKTKATKVPVMKKDRPYTDWKKELWIWESTNTTLDVDKKIQAGVLFESLEGIARDTVLSELSVEEISHADGVRNIIKTLDEYFIGNETQNAFKAIDDIMTYKRKADLSMEKFIVEFQLKVNKVKTSGTTLPDGVLGYALLNAANLSPEKFDMCKATCDTLTYKTVKAQLEKIGLGNSSMKSNIFSTVDGNASTSSIKMESFYGHLPTQHGYYGHESSGNSSDEDLNGEKVFFSGNKWQPGNGNIDNKKFKMNPTDRFGHVRACTCCKCVYHWLVDCPYAPAEIKNSVANKSRYRHKPYDKVHKPL